MIQDVVWLARISAAGGIGFLGCQLAALSQRDHSFQPTRGSAMFEHLGAVLFLLFILGFGSVMQRWERAGSATDATPASDGARASGLFLAAVLLVASAAQVAGRDDTWRDLALALDTLCLLPLVALVPFLTVVTRSPTAPTGFAVAGWIVAGAGLVRALALLVEDQDSIFAKQAITGRICFSWFVIWIGAGSLLALRSPER